MRSYSIRPAVVLVALLLLVVTTATAVATAPEPYTAQAAAAGLNATQARGLQQRVDAVLQTEGGTQIGLNKVLWKDGSGVTMVVVPGESEVRSFGPAGQDFHGCDYKWMCLYQFDSWRGTLHGLFYCQDYRTSYDFFSWVNRQTPGTIGRFKNINRGEITNTGPAYSESSWYDGTSTYWVRPC